MHFCGKNGHTIEVCYKKHGYPPGHKFHNSSRPANANAVNVENEVQENVTDDSSPSFNFTAEQCQSLLALIQPFANNIAPARANFASINQNTASTSQQGTTDVGHWILDSGATNHICHSLHYFTSYKMINPINVHLPNGSQLTCSYFGTIHFNNLLYLHNVLYIPEFSFNLISVTKLTKSLNC